MELAWILKRNALIFSIALAVVVAFIGFVIVPDLLSRTPRDSAQNDLGLAPPPIKVAGLEFGQIVKGQKALAEIDKLHGKDIQIKAGYIVQYHGTRSGKSATLWVGQTANVSQAKIFVEQMTSRIKAGNTPFQMREEKQVNGRLIYTMFGLNQAQFVYSLKDKVIWLSADDDLAERALEDVVNFY